MIVHSARFDELDAHTLYALLKLRTDIFVVEQKCPYPDLDGRDHEPTARHLWVAPADQPAHPRAYLRVLIEPGGSQRIGRVCTAVTVRGTGLSGLLVAASASRRPARSSSRTASRTPRCAGADLPTREG
jgi:ElaA protein